MPKLVTAQIVRQVGPGMVLPALIYLVVSRWAPVLVALAAASSVPLLDVLLRLARRRPLRPASVALVLGAAVSVGLALWTRSPMFILAKGATVSGILGLAFAGSAAVRRPLTRTLAIRLTGEHAEARRRLAERWRHPKAVGVFCVLSLGWGVLLVLSAVQQAVMAVTFSPGMVLAIESPLRTAVVALGTLASMLYFRRFRHAHPDLGLLTTVG